MDRVLNAILSFSAEQEWEKLSKDAASWGKALRSKTSEQYDTAINSLDYTSHSFGVCHLLFYKAHTEMKEHAKFVGQVAQLCRVGTAPQLRLCAPEFVAICREMERSSQLSDYPPKSCLIPLEQAMSKLQGQRKNLLTPLHADYCRISLASKLYARAVPFLKKQILIEVDASGQGFTARDFLEFNYYASMLHIGMKEFSTALDHLKMNLTMDSRAVSAIQLESFKKFTLVSLLANGVVEDLGSISRDENSGAFVQRVCKPLSGPYNLLARAWKNGAVEVDQCIAENKEALEKDNNLGLAKQLSKSLVRNEIQRLTKTYVTLSLKDIAQHANLQSPEAAEAYLLNMIEEGALAARIDQERGMISFLENTNAYDTSSMVQNLSAEISKFQELSSILQDLTTEVDSSLAFVSKTTPDKTSQGGVTGKTQMDLVEDADLQMAINRSMET